MVAITCVEWSSTMWQCELLHVCKCKWATKIEGKQQEKECFLCKFLCNLLSNSSAIWLHAIWTICIAHRSLKCVYRLLYRIFQQIQLNLICCRCCLLIQHTKDLLQYQINSIRRYNFFYAFAHQIEFYFLSFLRKKKKKKNSTTKQKKSKKEGRSFVIQASPFSWLFIYQFCYSLVYSSTIHNCHFYIFPLLLSVCDVMCLSEIQSGRLIKRVCVRMWTSLCLLFSHVDSDCVAIKLKSRFRLVHFCWHKSIEPYVFLRIENKINGGTK